MNLIDSVCSTCNQPMIYTGKDHHPACGPDGHLYRVTKPESARDAALKAVADKQPGNLADALSIITEAARLHPKISANLVRDDMRARNVPGPVVGAAFRQAAKDGVIRQDGFVRSTDTGTKAHHVGEWQSLLWRGAA